jgi:dihydroorotase
MRFYYRICLSAFIITSQLFSIADTVFAQTADMLLQNGMVFDSEKKIFRKQDVLIQEGKILAIGLDLKGVSAKKILNLRGLLVCPGLIDIHTHVFTGPEVNRFANGTNSISPDDFCLRSGVTTVVDAGTAGWKNFDLFYSQNIQPSKTRILSFVNIAGDGMTGDPRQEDLTKMDPQAALGTIQKYKSIIVGVKIGHYEGTDWAPFDAAKILAENAGLPLFVECHLPAYSLEDQLARMRPGDIITHTFEKVHERMPILDSAGKLRSFVAQAASRGILFDLGHGGAGFWYDQAIPAFRQQFWPHTFGTDFHRFSMNAGMKDMLNVLSKFLAIGMPLEELIFRATAGAAQAIRRPELGAIKKGNPADIAVLNIRQGRFGFTDAGGTTISGNKKLEAELTLRDGKIVWDLNGISTATWKIKN